MSGIEDTQAEVLLTVADRVATLTLNRPDRLNALTPAMNETIETMLRACERDPAVAAIVITGAGRGFCSGLDLAALSAAISADAHQPAYRGPGLFSFLIDISKPIIAAVNGVAVGGGFILAMMADLRFASTTARFSTVFSRRGLVAEHGLSHILPRQVGLTRAMDLILSARTFDADEAFAIGFVNQLHPPETLLAAAQDYARMLANQVSPMSMAAAKRQIYEDLGRGVVEAYAATDALVHATLGHPDQHEALAAAVEKRSATFAPWTGGALTAEP